MVMLPREHGAYSQMVLPLVTSFVVAGATLAAELTACAVVFGFLAHEPLIVLLGRRGVRVKAQSARQATGALALNSAAMLIVGVAAVAAVAPGIRWSFALPLVPAMVVAAGLMTRQEKSGPVEIAVALAFSLSAVPICLAAGASTAVALSVGVVFALVFVAGVLAVRVVILRVRGGGRPSAVRTTRLALIALVGAGGFVLTAAALRAALPWATVVAAAPGLVSALSLAFWRTTPKLKTVGWTLMSTSTAAAIILMAGV